MQLPVSTATATGCPSCHGTGIIVPPARPPDIVNRVTAHPYTIACACPAAQEPAGSILLGNYHALALASAQGLVAWVDREMVVDVERLWNAGIPTYGSCKGSITAPTPRYIITTSAAIPYLHWVTASRPLATGLALCGPVQISLSLPGGVS